MAGTVNVYERLEASLTDGSVAVGSLSRPFTATLTSGLHYSRSYSISDAATSVKIFDEDDFADPVVIRIEWTDGPVEIAWGENATAANADTSSFISNDATGGFLYLWGSGQQSHNGEPSSDRNSIDGGGSDAEIQEIWIVQTSGASITVRLDAFK
jgi:hypothetical protein